MFGLPDAAHWSLPGGLYSCFLSAFHRVQSSRSFVLIGDRWQIMPNEAPETKRMALLLMSFAVGCLVSFALRS